MVERAEIRMKPREKNLEKHGVKKEKNRRRKNHEEANGIAGVVLAAGSSVGRAAGSAASGSGKPGGSGKCRSRRGRREQTGGDCRGKVQRSSRGGGRGEPSRTGEALPDGRRKLPGSGLRRAGTL